MRMIDLIAKKRDGGPLSEAEVNFIINGYTSGEIPDYQMAAWAMAVYFQGMTFEETASLTAAMAHSGEMIDLSPIAGIKVDKHSTGGVGDTTTLVLVPLVAAAGVPVAKMSGRGLGHTGGTIDKMASIPGFQTELTSAQFIDQVNRMKAAVMSQSGNLTPADQHLYSLRDVTGTVNSLPLIASSIMSKKIAAGADAIVLDVKVGHGAFMKTVSDAEQLAETMVEIGRRLNRQTTAVISDMDQPLGWAVGNALEIKEAIDTLRGEGPDDLTNLSLSLGAQMLVLGGVARDEADARQTLISCIEDGSALQKFREIIAAQGGDASVIDQPDKLPQAAYQFEVTAAADGIVQAIEAEEIGIAASMLGAGRRTKEAEIDLAVGIVLAKKVGQHVNKGDALAILHANDQEVEAIRNKAAAAFKIHPEPCDPHKLIHKIVK